MRSGDSQRFKYGNPDLDDHYCCYYCGLSDKKVEAGGMWCCPNIACHGPGNSYYRSKLPSTINRDGAQEVDDWEWMESVEKNKESLSPSIQVAVTSSLIKIRIRLLGESFGI
jgi:ribosomal protein L37AE/L43A